MFILDSHCDTPSQILRLRNMSLDNDHAHVDFPKLFRGGVNGAFFALYSPASLDTDAAYSHANILMNQVMRVIEENPDKVSLTVSPSQAYANQNEGRFSLFLGLENGSPIGHSIERLHEFHHSGVRYITLCHSKDNQICDSCASVNGRWNGLSPYGRSLVVEMNKLGMLIDVSHASDSTFYDVIDQSTKPIVATHSCCRELADHPRNMTDDMIRTLASAGGVIQINFYPLFLDSGFAAVLADSKILERGSVIEEEFIKDPANPAKRSAWYAIQDELTALSRPSYKLIAEHIDHVVSIAGVEHVGLGSDYDGIEITPAGMEDISMMPKLIDELRRRGYSDLELSMIAGGNFFRVMEECQR